MSKKVAIEVYTSPAGLTIVTPDHALSLADIHSLWAQLIDSGKFLSITRVYRLGRCKVGVTARSRPDLSLAELAAKVQAAVTLYMPIEAHIYTGTISTAGGKHVRFIGVVPIPHVGPTYLDKVMSKLIYQIQGEHIEITVEVGSAETNGRYFVLIVSHPMGYQIGGRWPDLCAAAHIAVTREFRFKSQTKSRALQTVLSELQANYPA